MSTVSGLSSATPSTTTQSTSGTNTSSGSASPSAVSSSAGSSAGGAVLSSLGIGSGIDIQSLVTQLVNADGTAPQAQLNAQQAQYTAQVSALGSLKSALSTFEQSVAALKDPSTFQAQTATSSDTSVFSATAGSSAVPGTYNIEVDALAQPQKLMSAGFSSGDTVVGTGALQISSGSTSFSVKVDSSNNSLTGIAQAINSASGNTAVTATVINVDNGSGGTVSKLVLTSKNPGTANAVTVGVSDSDGNNTDASGLSQLATGNLTQIQAAQDASIKVDNQSITRSTNKINDAISGITLDLASAKAGSTETLTVATDTTGIKSRIQNFVTNYNQLITTINGMSSYNAQTQQGGVLLGDPTILSITSALRGMLGQAVSSVTGPYNTLASLGITSQLDGTLSINNSTLDSALSSHLSDVANLFSGSDGIAVKMDSQLNSFTGSDGIIQSEVNGLNSSIADVQKQQTQLQQHLQQLTQQYTAQFTAMDSLVSQLQSTGNYLSTQLSSLPLPGGGTNGGSGSSRSGG